MIDNEKTCYLNSPFFCNSPHKCPSLMPRPLTILMFIFVCQSNHYLERIFLKPFSVVQLMFIHTVAFY